MYTVTSTQVTLQEYTNQTGTSGCVYTHTHAHTQCGTGNVFVCYGADPDPRCPVAVSGNVAFYAKFQPLWPRLELCPLRTAVIIYGQWHENRSRDSLTTRVLK